MGTVKINASRSYTAPIYIGREEENKVTVVQFDLSDWINLYGSGSATLRIKRRGDRNPYPVPLVISDGIATWIISSTDTQIRGHGEAQLTYYVDDKIKKSIIYGFYVTQSLPAEGSAPDPYESWITTLEQLSADTLVNVQEAQEAERNAKASEQSAGQSAQSAGQSVDQAEAYRDEAKDSAESAEQSAQSAEEFADLAGQHASEAGYVIFDVNDQDGKLYVKKTDNMSGISFEVNDSDGTLGVIMT